jgi:hypothetical protein
VHELAKGKDGDVSNLPIYSEQERERVGLVDFAHFQDELRLANYNPDLYTYNKKTGAITLTPGNVKGLLPGQHYVSEFTPYNLTVARNAFKRKLSEINSRNQLDVDKYNKILKENIANNSINDQFELQNLQLGASVHAGNYLLHFDPKSVYDQHKMTYTPITGTFGHSVSGGNVTSVYQKDRKRTLNTRAAEKLDLSVDKYHELKASLQEHKIVNASDEQVAQVIKDL